jgi:hypothetical protein
MANKYTVEIGAKDAGYTRTVSQINQSTKSMDGAVKSAATSVNASFGSMVKAGAALALGFGAVKLAINSVKSILGDFSDALDLGGKLNDLSSRTGESAGNLLVLQRAFENAGSSAEKVGPTINKLQKFMDDAAQGQQLNIDTLQRLGLSYDDLKGKAPIEQMEMLASRISGIEDPGQRAAIAMTVFGRAGGELLPVLQNFSSELQRSRDQLGSMPEVIDRSNVSFDRISDNIEVIKTKFRDFAAGLLERLAPALEFATELLTRFDAAAMGMKLGDVLVGAGNGMNAFKEAIQAISFGDFTLAWSIAWSAVKITVSESINSIYANIKGLFAAIGTMLEQSGITVIFESLFSGIANKITSVLRGAIADFLDAIGKVSAAEEMRLFSKADEDRANNYFKIVQAGFASLGDNAAAALAPMSEAYDKARDSAGKLIDTTEQQAELEHQRIALRQQIIDNLIKETAVQDEQAQTERGRVSNAERIAELEKEIVQAKKEGNAEKQKELEAQKAYYVELEKSLKAGKSLQEAVTNASKAQFDYAQKAAQAGKEPAAASRAPSNSQSGQFGSMPGQTFGNDNRFGFAQQMMQDTEQMRREKQLDPGGRLRGRFAEAQAQENTNAMSRYARIMEDRETKRTTQELFSEVTGKKTAAGTSLQDMAKELEVDTFRKTQKELRKNVEEELQTRKEVKGMLDSVNDDLQKRKKDEAEKAKKEPEVREGGSGKQKEDDGVMSVVNQIAASCKAIEKKLPQVALAS